MATAMAFLGTVTRRLAGRSSYPARLSRPARDVRRPNPAYLPLAKLATPERLPDRVRAFDGCAVFGTIQPPGESDGAVIVRR
jgi:hypothetical protein